jgi:hypothetical protein
MGTTVETVAQEFSPEDSTETTEGAEVLEGLGSVEIGGMLPIRRDLSGSPKSYLMGPREEIKLEF